MDTAEAEMLLSDAEVVPCAEGQVAQARAIAQLLLDNGIPALLDKPAPKACCAGGCGCGAKLVVLVREEDAPRVGQVMHGEWLEAVRREGTVDGSLVPLKTPEEGELCCPACSFVGPLKDGDCADCGLTLE